MFYTRLIELCNLNDISLSALTAANGIAKGNVTRWKNGSIPNGDTLIKLANYFNCSVDYLLGLTDNNNTVTNSGKSFTITNQDLQRLKDFIRYFDNNSNDG